MAWAILGFLHHLLHSPYVYSVLETPLRHALSLLRELNLIQFLRPTTYSLSFYMRREHTL